MHEAHKCMCMYKIHSTLPHALPHLFLPIFYLSFTSSNILLIVCSFIPDKSCQLVPYNKIIVFIQSHPAQYPLSNREILAAKDISYTVYFKTMT